ncbi:hypothetical protein PV325_009177 [Microctonus aethiopoides]|nr:hypothetical protein PV325_009177 [Microctonus aethiopoides]KAK0076025.1 hypothetical protein PV326_011125 [Microctonus aethiopoides]
MLMEPVNRGSAWRKNFDTPINYDDNANYCGGYHIHYQLNGGRCGSCGDNYAQKQPRPNENGGVYGTGQIVETYTASQEFIADVMITSNHRGFFKFDLCPIQAGPNYNSDVETEECFEKFPIMTVYGDDKYIMKKFYNGHYQVHLILPDNVTCDHCSMRWTYVTANNWGICSDGTGAIGCGPQETFKTCSDIKIVKL